MTEEEAKTKTCCASFSPVAFTAMNVGGGVYQSIEPRNCIGSACMAWRWDEIERTGQHGHWIAPTLSGTDGHCGLAGKP